jgi:hypothetical protein
MSKMKNIIKSFHSRIDQRISILDDKSNELTWKEGKSQKRFVGYIQETKYMNSGNSRSKEKESGTENLPHKSPTRYGCPDSINSKNPSQIKAKKTFNKSLL